MSLHCRIWIVLIYFVIAASRSVYVSAAQCDSILQYAAANIQQRTSKSVAQAEMANYLCTENYEQRGSSERAAIEASYAVFSAKYGTDSTSFREWRQKHCESGQSKDFRRTDSTEYARIVHDNSVDAWVKCLELENSGVLVQPAFDSTGKFMNFNVKYTGAGSVKLTGVSIQPPGSFECKDARKRSVGSDTEVQLSPKAWALECTRVVEKVTDASGGKYESAPAAMLTIRTEEKLFPMQFTEFRSPDIATRNAAELMQTIQSLKNELSDLKKKKFSILEKKIADLERKTEYIFVDNKRTFIKGGSKVFVAQDDGNFVVYDSSAKPIWDSDGHTWKK